MDLTESPGESRARDDLFARAQAGDQEAWAVLFNECYPKVRRAARQRLSGTLRRYVDSTDIASDVIGELAQNAARFQFQSIEEVKKFLFNAAHQRIIDQNRRHSTKKRDRGRERPLGYDGVDDDAFGISSGEPTPSQIAVAHETDEQLLAQAEDEGARQLLILRGQNYDNQEIARRIGWSLRQIQRFLAKLRISRAS